MSNRWFRFYHDVINDPKVLSLPEAMRWSWVAVLCAASKNDGKLPEIQHLALMLRVSKQRAASILAALRQAGLVDKTETGFAPHNWEARQYKSDVSNDRVKRFRERKCNVTSAVTVTAPESDTETESDIDRRGEARARGQSAFTEGSKALANAFWKALGFNNPLEIPPEFAGVDWRAIEWERARWTVDLIDAEARKLARDGPLKPLTYFEKVFATSFAKRQTPLPIVQVREAEKLTVTGHGRPQSTGGNVIQAADRLIDKIRSFDAGAEPDHGLRGAAGEAPVRLLSQRGSE
jgi:hypothetical protein